MRHALIIAGGSGTRFWPASRKALPKQFLRFGGEHSLLQATARRVRDVQLWVVCGRAHEALVRNDLPSARVIVEASAKNTAPAIALALREIAAVDPDALIAALPADHHVRDEAAFARSLDEAFAEARDALVTLGIKPTRPETGFGYIERGSELRAGVHMIARFVEKPDVATAERFVADARYAWNGGIFVFNARHMQALFEQHAPAVWKAVTSGQWEACPSISIDYAIAEKAQGLRVVAMDAGWSDVGSWDAVGEVQPADRQGNIGPVVAVDAANNTVSAQKTVCLLGVHDLIVVDTPDAILVAPRGQAQRVREMVAALEKSKPDLL